MYILARSRRANPSHNRAAVGSAIEAARRVTDIIGTPVSAWSSVLSPDTGTISWSARFEHLADVITGQDALVQDPEFVAWIEQNDPHFTGPLTEIVSEVIHGAPSGPPAPYLQVVRAVAANGALGEAFGVAVEVAQTAAKLTGHETMVLAPVNGPFGAFAWLTGFDDLSIYEFDNEALTRNPDWLALVDRAGRAFQPGVESSMLRRLA
jgi:hypothetical protein